jgi:pilus assembly protein CpaC
MFKLTLSRILALSVIFLVIACNSMAQTAVPPEPVPTPPAAPESVNFNVRSPNERLEMIVHTSRIITIGQKIPQAQVNNPDILDMTPLSPTQVQVSAKTTGVTQINIWGEDQKLFTTIDVIVYGDARELKMLLQSLFPNAALTVIPVSSSVLISGFVDKAEHIDRIIRIAEEYYPKVINNMTVGGVQTVLLHVKVMEVSRTKLRRLGFDWAKLTGGNMVTSGASGMIVPPFSPSLPAGIGSNTPPAAPVAQAPITGSTFAFNIVNGSSAFFGVLNALRRDNMVKIMAEPTLVAESGRAASFNSGGKIPVPTPQSLGTISIDWQKYGTQIDFVPIVLGNGKILLEVRPSISELDYANSTTISGTTVPGIRSRDVDTAVELMAGQTLAIAGLVQSRTESENMGLPWISEVPYLGMPFRQVHETSNEVELLIMVTPELVDGMDAGEVPPCGPGMNTTSPTDWELYMKGHLEVPNCCPNGENCSQCAPGANGSQTPMPDEGMIGPEQISTPTGTSAIKNPSHGGKNASVMASANTQRRSSGSSTPYNRYTSSKVNKPSGNSTPDATNAPPGFIGPVGYDVVK